MNKGEEFHIYLEGYDAFNPDLNVYDVNPYKMIEKRGEDVSTFQVEATPFFNGWEFAKKTKTKLPSYFLFLDDFRFPNWVNSLDHIERVSWRICRHYYDFVEIITKYGIPNFISWDFDLDRHNLPMGNLSHKNGAECVQWLIEFCDKSKVAFPASYIHSANVTGRLEIYNLINNYFKKNEQKISTNPI